MKKWLHCTPDSIARTASHLQIFGAIVCLHFVQMIGMGFIPFQGATAPKTAGTPTFVLIEKNDAMLKGHAVLVRHRMAVTQDFHIAAALKVSTLDLSWVGATCPAHPVKMLFAKCILRSIRWLATAFDRAGGMRSHGEILSADKIATRKE